MTKWWDRCLSRNVVKSATKEAEDTVMEWPLTLRYHHQWLIVNQAQPSVQTAQPLPECSRVNPADIVLPNLSSSDFSHANDERKRILSISVSSELQCQFKTCTCSKYHQLRRDGRKAYCVCNHLKPNHIAQSVNLSAAEFTIPIAAALQKERFVPQLPASMISSAVHNTPNVPPTTS